MMKKFFVFFLTFCIMLSCITSVAAETKQFDGTAGDYNMLCGIELLKLPDGSDMKLEDKISRKYMSMIAVKLAYGTENMSMGDSYGAFNDLSVDDDLYSYVRLACQGGLMSSDGGNFEPDRIVTYNEIIKIIVCAAGYGNLAEIKGGFPNGYLSVASDMGITRGIKYPGNTEMTVEMIVPIMCNALEADLMEVSEVADGSMQYDVKKGKSFLDRMDIKQIEGTITATEYTDIFGGKTMSEGFVKIDGETYKTKIENIAEYVGAYVKVYYKDDSNEILYFKGKSKAFEEKTIKSSDITEISGTSEITVKYTSDAKEEKIKISATAREFYNEVYNGGAELEKHIREIKDDINGSMRLFDNDGDGVFDVVHLHKYESYMTSYVDAAGKKIYLKNADMTYIDLSDKTVETLIVIRNGEKKTIADIKTDDVLQYSASKDGKVVKIVATGLNNASDSNSEKKLEGRVISITEENNHAIINIDGLTYVTTADFWSRNKNSIIIGRNYTFYMNAEKQIAYIAADSTGEKYAFLLNMAAESTIGSNIKVKLLTPDNKIVIYETTDGFTHYDGNIRKKIRSMDNVYSSAALYDSESKHIKRQVIRYFADDWNKITTIYTARDNFRFMCVPTTEINSDGTWKTSTQSNEYSEEDFYIRKIETINPLETDIYVNRPREQGGMVPVTVVAPEEIDESDNSLQVNYKNFDVGKYIADDKNFAFFKFGYDPVTDTWDGLHRASKADTGDKFKNSPGKTYYVEDNRVLDQKYLLTPATALFKVPLEIDEHGNINVNNTAEESLYKAISSGEIETNISGGSPFMLYDIDKGHLAGAAIYGDKSTLKFGGNKYSWIGVLAEDVHMELDSEGTAKLKVRMFNTQGQEVEYFFEDENAKDAGCMMQYYNKYGEYIGPNMIEYYGNGASRKGRKYYAAYGMYEGRAAKDLKLGDMIEIAFNNKGEIKSFFTLFDGNLERDYYEARIDGDSDTYGMNTNEIQKYNHADEDYNEIDATYGNYTFRNSGSEGSEVSLNNSGKWFMYFKIKEKTSVGSNTFAIVESRLPSWNYRDRVGSTNGSHDQIYIDENGDIFLRLERMIEIHNRGKIYVVDSKRKKIERTTADAICIGDKVASYQPHWEWGNLVVVYKED